MFRTSDVVLIAVMLSAAAFTYKTKHDAEAMMDRIGKLETNIQLEKDSIDILKADWSLFTQPGRLQKLAEAYQTELGLQVTQAQQIVDFSALGSIPFPVDKVGDLIAELGVADPAQEIDPTATGGVRP
ncbi:MULTISPECIES: cell division protein FtsL [Chelativorans]|uniref:cell division protein FtsL n=1 Tax=Chelativorans TaxID=449972 RepID=UPI0005A2E1B9|nr:MULTISPECIES: hypothetical protein [Chelativorans]